MTTPEYQNQNSVPLMPIVKRESALAITSLITGIVGWTILPFIGSIVAVITGHLAKKEIRESGGTIGGDGMAIAGLILGYTMIGLVLLGIICFFTVIVALVPAISNEVKSLSSLIQMIV
jgi:hypothetical protein